MTTTEPRSEANNQDDTIRPFTVEFPQADLDDLHRRVRETRWPEQETVDDASQGVQLEVVKAARRPLGRTGTTGEPSRRASTGFRSSSRRSTGSTSTSSTCGLRTRMRCR